MYCLIIHIINYIETNLILQQLMVNFSLMNKWITGNDASCNTRKIKRRSSLPFSVCGG